MRIIKKHLRKSQDNPSGKIAEREGPIHISNAIDRENGKERKTAKKETKAKKEKAKVSFICFAKIGNGKRILQRLRNGRIPALQKQHGYKNIHQVPKVDKVVINTSVGSQSDVKRRWMMPRWNWR